MSVVSSRSAGLWLEQHLEHTGALVLERGIGIRSGVQRQREKLGHPAVDIGLIRPHLDKTHLIEFGRRAAGEPEDGGRVTPATFDFRGSTAVPP